MAKGQYRNVIMLIEFIHDYVIDNPLVSNLKHLPDNLRKYCNNEVPYVDGHIRNVAKSMTANGIARRKEHNYDATKFMFEDGILELHNINNTESRINYNGLAVWRRPNGMVATSNGDIDMDALYMLRNINQGKPAYTETTMTKQQILSMNVVTEADAKKETTIIVEHQYLAQQWRLLESSLLLASKNMSERELYDYIIKVENLYVDLKYQYTEAYDNDEM